MMCFLNNLGKLVTDLVTTPVAVVSDVINTVPLLMNEKGSKTKKKLENLIEDIENLADNDTD